MKFGIVSDELFTRHQTPDGHPERPARLRAIDSALQVWEGTPQLTRVNPSSATAEQLLAVHSKPHYRRIQATASQHHLALDPDTHTSNDSFETASLAAGSGIQLADLLFQGEIDSGFLLARPPGHHAESDRAMGFCLFNNVAVAAQWALDQKKAKKIAIVDFDVHHGNGTQQIFYGRRDVLYISSHQFPFYPGTGSILETGSGEGEGYTVNFPLTAGRGDTFHLAVYAHLVDPILRSYEPDLILVSAGYDSHRRDPLGGMEVSTKGFGTLATILNQAAAQLCAGRILYFLEGGYDLEALAASVIETIGITLEPPEEFPSLPQVESAFEVYATQVKKVLGRYWKF